jgi:hypothetical protein
MLRIFHKLFQKRIGKWADKCFPSSSIRSCICHLDREVMELKNSYKFNPWIDLETVDLYELVDIYLLLLHISHKQGFDLMKYAKKKHSINKKRKWGKPDKDGVVEHLREKGFLF